MIAEIYRGRNALILENILGADNELLPPESSIEEILQSILYNTPFTKTLVNPSNNEKLLLAIKNGTPFTETLVNPSRNEQILLSIINHQEYNAAPQSYIEMLLIEWLEKGMYYELTGVPPLTFHSNGQPLIDWTIYGATGGVGNKTDNLVPAISDDSWVPGWFDAGVVKLATSYREKTSDFVELPAESQSITVYSPDGFPYTSSVTPWIRLGFFDADNNYLSQSTAAGNVLSQGHYTFDTIPENCSKVRLSCRTFGEEFRIMMNVGKLKAFEPYGYKITVVSLPQTTNIYIDEPLTEGETITSIGTGVEIPTVDGENTLTVETTVQPEKVYIKYEPHI